VIGDEWDKVVGDEIRLSGNESVGSSYDPPRRGVEMRCHIEESGGVLRRKPLESTHVSCEHQMVRSREVFIGCAEHFGEQTPGLSFPFPVTQYDGIPKRTLCADGSWSELVIG